MKCEKCGEERATKYFNQIRDPKTKKTLGYRHPCKVCSAQDEKELHEAKVEAMKADREAKQKAKVERAKRRTQPAKPRKKPVVPPKSLGEQARAELASRLLARKKFIHFVERFYPGYMAGWVHVDVCERLDKFLDDVEAGKSPRLMLWLPPRHGKSLLASDMFPSYALGRNPAYEVIACSYAVSLPLGFSRKIRNRIVQPEFKAVFPTTTLDPKSQAAEQWNTTRGGGYRAAGVGGGITGMGAHILIVDDPVKDAEEADSENIRESTWNWFGSTAYTRIAPGGGCLVVQTRWHDDDLSGRLHMQMVEAHKELDELEVELMEELESTTLTKTRRIEVEEQLERVAFDRKTIDEWEIVMYPAVATADEYMTPDKEIVYEPKPGYLKLRSKGEALHKARFDEVALNKIKRTLQPRHWSALYQQNPVPDEGLYFTKDMLRFERTSPDHRRMYTFAAWDLAIGQKQTNDYTVGIIGALDWDGRLHILDMIRARMDTFEIAQAMVSVQRKWRPVLTGIEKGQLELALRPVLTKLMLDTKVHITLAEGKEALKPITDKVVRARPLQGLMQQGMVYLPYDQPWVETLIQELLRFPGAVHDDIVDGLAWLARMVVNHSLPKKPEPKHKVKSWKDMLRSLNTGSGSKDPMAA